jgi:hypothetical protein
MSEDRERLAAQLASMEAAGEGAWTVKPAVSERAAELETEVVALSSKIADAESRARLDALAEEKGRVLSTEPKAGPVVLYGPWIHEGAYSCRVRQGVEGFPELDWRYLPAGDWELGEEPSLETAMASAELARLATENRDLRASLDRALRSERWEAGQKEALVGELAILREEEASLRSSYGRYVEETNRPEPCDGCAGTGTAASGRCGCGGTGRMADMVLSLRTAALTELPRRIRILETANSHLATLVQEQTAHMGDPCIFCGEASNILPVGDCRGTRTALAAERDRLRAREITVGWFEAHCVSPGEAAQDGCTQVLTWSEVERSIAPETVAELGETIDRLRSSLAAREVEADAAIRSSNDRAQEAMLEADRLRALVSKMRGHAVHDANCPLNVCSCGLDTLLADPDGKAAEAWLSAREASAREEGRQEILATRIPSDPVAEALADGEEDGYERGRREGLRGVIASFREESAFHERVAKQLEGEPTQSPHESAAYYLAELAAALEASFAPEPLAIEKGGD